MSDNPAFRIFNGLAPAELPKCYPINFTVPGGMAGTVIVFPDDLVRPLTEERIAFIQGAWIDNSESDGRLIFNFLGTGQRLIVPSRSQGVYPIIASNPLSYVMSAIGAVEEYEVKILFLNVPTSHFVWSI